MGDQLREVVAARQVPGEPRRRWFTSSTMDLIVWTSDGEGKLPMQMQLCYDKGGRRQEKVLGWRPAKGFSHKSVDDGESGGPLGGPKATPLLTGDAPFDAERVAALFKECGGGLPAEVAAFVQGKIEAYASAAPQSSASVGGRPPGPYAQPKPFAP